MAVLKSPRSLRTVGLGRPVPKAAVKSWLVRVLAYGAVLLVALVLTYASLR